MSHTTRVKEWRTRQKDEGKAPVTIWLSRDEKRRLEGLAQTWHCSTSELVQQALAAFQPGSPPVTAAITDTEQLRQFITETVTDIVTATLPALVRDLVGGMTNIREQTAMPVTVTGNRNATETHATPGRVTVPCNSVVSDTGSQPSPEKAAVVARLREMRAGGMSYGEIATQMQADGVPTLSRKGVWQKGTVAKLLASQSADTA
jgi:hypothetical protein